jgi:hypothetical protein
MFEGQFDVENTRSAPKEQTACSFLFWLLPLSCIPLLSSLGQWVAGHIQGKGKYTFASGASYDGEWVADRFQGRGTYQWAAPSTASYTGDWVDNKMHGVGAFLASSGDRYQGVFHNDRFQNAQGHWIAPMDNEQPTRK